MMLSQRSETPFEGLCARDRRNAGLLRRWTLVWAFSFVIASLFLGPSADGPASVSPWLNGIVAVPLVAGALMIRSYLRFLSEADELVRLILLRAAAGGFGVVFALGIVFWLASQIFGEWEDAGAITWVVGFLTVEFSFLRQWKTLSAQPSA